MAKEDKEKADLRTDLSVLQERVKFLERTVYWFIGFVALNLIGSFMLWISTLGQ